MHLEIATSGINSGTKRYRARKARESIGSNKIPQLQAGVYPVIIDSFSATPTVVSIEMGDIWVIDEINSKVLHFSYAGAGPAAGLSATYAREFGALYLDDAGALSGFSVSFESDGTLAIGGSGTIALPTYPLNPKSTSLSGGPAIGFGAGLSIIGTWAWFKKVYSFSETPGHLPLGASKYP